jgi:hypothetical protein
MRQDKQALIVDFAPFAQQLEEQGVNDVLVPVRVRLVGGSAVMHLHIKEEDRSPHAFRFGCFPIRSSALGTT